MEKFLQNALAFFCSFFILKFDRIIIAARGMASKREVASRLRSLGHGVHFNGRVYISDPKETTIGNNVHIGNNAYFKTEGGLSIGDNTHISRNVTIYTVNHNYEGERLPYDNTTIKKPVAIQKNVWIGMNVSITPGVTVGEGAIIGMGAVVTSDVPPLAIIGNMPARVLKYREAEHYNRLEHAMKYGGSGGRLFNLGKAAKIKPRS